MRSTAALAVLASALALVACGEKAQTFSRAKPGVAASQGANPAYTAGTWKAGDAAAWEAQIKTRAQSQNEYVRIAAP
jgi:hypothetical protein